MTSFPWPCWDYLRFSLEGLEVIPGNPQKNQEQSLVSVLFLFLDVCPVWEVTEHRRSFQSEFSPFAVVNSPSVQAVMQLTRNSDLTQGETAFIEKKVSAEVWWTWLGNFSGRESPKSKCVIKTEGWKNSEPWTQLLVDLICKVCSWLLKTNYIYYQGFKQFGEYSYSFVWGTCCFLLSPFNSESGLSTCQ